MYPRYFTLPHAPRAPLSLVPPLYPLGELVELHSAARRFSQPTHAWWRHSRLRSRAQGTHTFSHKPKQKLMMRKPQCGFMCRSVFLVALFLFLSFRFSFASVSRRVVSFLFLLVRVCVASYLGSCALPALTALPAFLLYVYQVGGTSLEMAFEKLTELRKPLCARHFMDLFAKKLAAVHKARAVAGCSRAASNLLWGHLSLDLQVSQREAKESARERREKPPLLAKNKKRAPSQ